MDFKNIPVSLAHEVALRAADGREWKLTTITVRGGGSGGTIGYHTGGMAKGLDITNVDVIFRPDPHGARHTVDVTELWNHEFVVKQVPVQLPPPATKPAATTRTTTGRAS
jgi:hypothetical protein